jgi:iron(III) transport system permease protein
VRLWLWVAVGVLAYLVLPWYAIQDANGLRRDLPQVFWAGRETANGLVQAARYMGGPGCGWAGWAWLVAAWPLRCRRARRQGAVLLAGGCLGVLAAAGQRLHHRRARLVV